MEKQPLSHQPNRHSTSDPSFLSNTHNGRDGALWSNDTHGAYMIRSSIRGDPDTEHDHRYWSLSPPIPSWKLYENPFFTEGHLIPKFIPRYLNAPLHRSMNSFTTPDTQHASRGRPSNSHSGLTILAPALAIKGPIHSDATPHQPNVVTPLPSNLLMSKDKGMPGSLVVSARKLAASFWEQYRVHTLDAAEDQHLSDAQVAQPCPRATSDTLICPSMPSKFQMRQDRNLLRRRRPYAKPRVIPEALEHTPANCGTAEASNNNMASSPVATLANLLHRMRSVEENQSQSSAMLSKLTLEVKDVATRVHELEFSHKSALREINNLLQRFGEQMAISRRKEQEKARLAFMHLREEMEEERNSCRVLKIQNKKLTKDLTHANMAAADACEELDRERKARELLEEVCNELAREIGEDKAEVEQLKQEQAESRKRLEEEIKMMRMAAMWRGERVRSKLSDVQLELDHDKEGMPLHELRSKLEAFLSTIGVTCRGTRDEIELQPEHAKLLQQALELLELEESRRSQSSAKVFSSAALLSSAPASANACSIDEKVSTNTEHGSKGHHFDGDSDAVNGVGNKFSSKETRKPRKGRRHLRMIAQQRHTLGIKSQARVYDQNKVNFWGAHCASLGWSTSDDEQERGPLDTLPNSMQKGQALEQGAKDQSLRVHANSVNLEDDNMLPAGGHAGHTVQTMRPSFFARSSEPTVKKAPCHLEPSLHNGIAEHSPRRHSSSARFGVEIGRELDCKPDTGPSTHYSFSEDDATSYMGSRIERRRKQQSALHAQSTELASKPRQEEEESFNFIRNDQYDHDHLNGSKITGRGEVGTENSEPDEFYFEPVRGPIYASNGKLSEKAIEDEERTNVGRQIERGFSNCGDEACCRIMAKAGQSCKDMKDKVHDSIEGNTNFGGKETMNKMSPWRSASAKPLQCFWPPSPDAFPIFGGVKKRSKSGTSTPPAHITNEQQIHGVGGLRSHSQRDPSPAKEASFQLSASQHQQDVSMKSNSLGAQLIKARELDCNKPTKPSFRFSPLRRAISHG